MDQRDQDDSGEEIELPAEEDWFEPGKREGYEAALGRMILAYNEIDFRLSDVIYRAAERRGLPAPAVVGWAFEARLDVISFLGGIPDLSELTELDLDGLRELHNHRNQATHGHFHVDHDGSLHLRRWRKKGPVAIPGYDTARLNGIAERMRAQTEILHRMELLLWFDDHTDDDPEAR